MGLTRLTVMYGHLEGSEGKFARDPSGYLSIEAGIFQKHGLEVSWTHVQGTEERYSRLENGSAQVSLVVGRASLQHFLTSKNTRLLGCAMNSCSYYLVVDPSLARLEDLKGKNLVCREGPSRNTPIAETILARAKLRVGDDLSLQLPKGDLEAFTLLMAKKVQAALLPRPFSFWAEERGFKRIADWPNIVDDPLPITLETTADLLEERERDLRSFLAAQREGIDYLTSNRARTIKMLCAQFAHSPTFAAKTFDDYLVCMNKDLKVDIRQLERLLAQVAPGTSGGARQVASEWIIPRALRFP
jgi:ABC-type nitrate/sulfonate/bicarbonate transport system substrate-binding protein